MARRSIEPKGFTLIELLVVIAIIGLLASIVLASLSSARNKAKDARRLSDMQQIQVALELYYSTNGHYPVTGWISHCGSGTPSQWLPGLAPTYMSSVPTDPDTTGSLNCYFYNSTGTSYKLLADILTSSSNVGAYPTYVDPARNYGTAWSKNSLCPGSSETTWAWAVWSDSVSMCW